MSVVAAIRAMLSQGLTVEQALAAAEAIEQAAAPKLTARQERNRRYYEAHRASEKRLNPSESVLQASETSELRRAPSPPPSPSPNKETSPRPPKENNPTPLPPPQPFSLSASDPFDDFWELFPNKVGKADARKKFPIALRKVDVGTLMEALGRYVAKTDDRPWCNPATWLHQERWGDQPAQVARGSPRGGGTGPKGLEWFDEAIDWIDDNERRRTEKGTGGDQDDDRGTSNLLIGHQR